MIQVYFEHPHGILEITYIFLLLHVFLLEPLLNALETVNLAPRAAQGSGFRATN